MGAPDRIRQRLLTTSHWIWGRRQADPVAVRAVHPRSLFKSPIEFLRAARLTSIESLRVLLDRNYDRIILSHNTPGENGARSYGGAKDRPGTHGGCLGVHKNLLTNASAMIRSIDNESSRLELDTLISEMTDVVIGRRRKELGVHQTFWLPFQTMGTHIHREREGISCVTMAVAEPKPSLVERFFADHRAALRAFFLRRIRGKADTADLAQEVYVRMLRVSD